MLKKSLTLVGLVAALLMAGSVVNWAAQGQQGVTLDPGQMVIDDSVRQVLIAEALPLIIQAGYETKEFNFEKAVADPEGTMLFVPVKDLSEKLKKLPALIGLLYAHEPFLLQGKIVPQGVHPIIQDTSLAGALTGASLHRTGDLGIAKTDQQCYNWFTISSDPPFIHAGFTCQGPPIGGPPPPPPPGNTPPPGPGGIYDQSATLLSLLCASDPTAFGC